MAERAEKDPGLLDGGCAPVGQSVLLCSRGLHSSEPSAGSATLSPRDGTEPADTGQHCLMEKKQTHVPWIRL